MPGPSVIPGAGYSPPMIEFISLPHAYRPGSARPSPSSSCACSSVRRPRLVPRSAGATFSAGSAHPSPCRSRRRIPTRRTRSCAARSRAGPRHRRRSRGQALRSSRPVRDSRASASRAERVVPDALVDEAPAARVDRDQAGLGAVEDDVRKHSRRAVLARDDRGREPPRVVPARLAQHRALRERKRSRGRVVGLARGGVRRGRLGTLLRCHEFATLLNLTCQPVNS